MSRESPERIDKDFEAAESHRKATTLKELRSFCQTKEALKSFEKFEQRLLKLHQDSNGASIVSRSTGRLLNDKSIAPSQVSQKSVEATATTHYLRASMNEKASGQLTWSNTEGTISNFAGNAMHWGRGLPKSKTAGNLAALGTGLLVSCQSTASKPVLTDSALARSSLYNKTIATTGSPSSRDLSDTHHGEKDPNSRIFSDSTVSSRSTQGDLTMGFAATKRGCETSLQFKNEDLNCWTHRESSAAISDACEGSNVKTHAMEELINETTTSRHRRKSSRRASGDLMKKVMDVSIREVRKMGRRVGSVSVSNSVDKLDLSRA